MAELLAQKVLHKSYPLLLAGQYQNILGKMHRADIWCSVVIFGQLVSILPFPSLNFRFEKLSISECVVSLVELLRRLSSWAGRQSCWG